MITVSRMSAAMTPERARELLSVERERIERALADLGEPVGTDELATIDDPADQGSELYERELEEGLLEGLRRELEALERAEARLAAGTYGISIESGKPIPDERLEAYPLAERTVEEERRR
jgi:DnaK suppressor protein